MRRDSPSTPPEQAKAVYMNVSFPSGWCPRCNIGGDYLQIHNGVPRFDRFGDTGRAGLARLLFNEHPIVRFAWGLSPTDALDRRKCRDPSTGHGAANEMAWKDASKVWLRVERQVVSRVDGLISCFFIRVYRYDAASLTDEIRDNIRSSLTNMPAQVREYKGFGADVECILSLL